VGAGVGAITGLLVGSGTGAVDGNEKQLVAPTEEDLPLGQSGHELDPDEAWYVPAAHWVQSLALLAPEIEQYVPASHEVHATEPVDSVYCPSAHSVHVEPEKSLLAWGRGHAERER